MMKTQSISLVIFVLLSIPAFSQTTSGIVETKAIDDLNIGNQKVRVQVNDVKSATTDQSLTAAQAAPFLKVIGEVGGMVLPMQLPRAVKLNLSQLTFDPSSNVFTDELNLGVRFAKLDDKNRVHTQNPSVMRAIAAHEFGHLIFAHNILATQSVLTDIVRYGNQAGDMEAALQKMRDEGDKLQALVTAQGGVGSPDLQAKIAQLEQQYQQGLDQLLKVQQQHNQVIALYERTSPYNEFFADVISLLYTENPNAIAEAIHFSMPNTTHRNDRNNKADILSRDFEVGKPINHDPQTPHAVMAQVRSALWENYLKQPSVMAQKSKVVGCLTSSTNSEVGWILSKKDVPNDPRVVRVLNERLWKSLDACLK
jgi:hypothetical protein